jgi:hypothetical protein
MLEEIRAADAAALGFRSGADLPRRYHSHGPLSDLNDFLRGG